MWSKSKRLVRPVFEGGLDYSNVSFLKPITHYIEIRNSPWCMETFMVVIKNLFVDANEGRVSVAGIKTILTPIVKNGERNDREQVTVTTVTFYTNMDEIMIIENDYGIHGIEMEE